MSYIDLGIRVNNMDVWMGWIDIDKGG